MVYHEAVLNPGLKRVAWQGVAVVVPAAWDLARHEGDRRAGALRIDGHDRVRLQVRWQPDRGGSLHEVARRAAALLRQTILNPSPLGRDGGEHRIAFDLSSSDDAHPALLAVVRQSQRLAVLRFDRHEGWPANDLLRQMLDGTTIQSAREWQDWVIYDMAWSSPPGHELRSASLQVGVARLEFGSARRWWALRRFSAASAAMGAAAPDPDRFERWITAVYNGERHDRHHDVSRRLISDGYETVLRGRSRWLSALEFRGVLPRHRRSAALVISRCYPAVNKVVCFEFDRPDADADPDLQRVMASYRVAQESLGPSPAPPSSSSGRTRALASRVRRRASVLARQDGVRVVLQSQVPRGAMLRWLSALGGRGTGPAMKTRTVELDLLGSLLWQRCAEPTPVQALIDALGRELQVAPLEASVAVTGFLQAMGSRGLLELVHDDPSNVGEGVAAGSAFTNDCRQKDDK
jgi:hypothetical protein